MDSENKINYPAVFVLLIYPAILISLGIHYSYNFGAGFLELGLFLVGYYVCNIAVGIGLHRLWSHDAYKINKYAEFILSLFAAGTLQGPALSWASNHFRHHTHTDTDLDPHSPLKYGSNKIKGFLWSHIGWMLVGDGSYKSIDRVTMKKLGRNKILRWQLKYYWQISVFMNVILPGLVGYIITGNYVGMYAGFVFIGLGRALQQQVTFFVNSLCHFFGTKLYYIGTAGDIWWLALLLLGENWHNFHHAFPADYRNGAKWYHFDVHKWIIFLMSKIGLASDLNTTSEVRVAAKAALTMEKLIASRKEEIDNLQHKINDIVSKIEDSLEYSDDTSDIKHKVTKSLKILSEKLIKLRSQMSEQIIYIERSSDAFFHSIRKKISVYENKAQDLMIKLETSKIEST